MSAAVRPALPVLRVGEGGAAARCTQYHAAAAAELPPLYASAEQVCHCRHDLQPQAGELPGTWKPFFCTQLGSSQCWRGASLSRATTAAASLMPASEPWCLSASSCCRWSCACSRANPSGSEQGDGGLWCLSASSGCRCSGACRRVVQPAVSRGPEKPPCLSRGPRACSCSVRAACNRSDAPLRPAAGREEGLPASLTARPATSWATRRAALPGSAACPPPG